MENAKETFNQEEALKEALKLIDTLNEQIVDLKNDIYFTTYNVENFKNCSSGHDLISYFTEECPLCKLIHEKECFIRQEYLFKSQIETLNNVYVYQNKQSSNLKDQVDKLFKERVELQNKYNSLIYDRKEKDGKENNN
jgi:hypothetical protein